jgi:pimeloyl-ACP methyl ester carboxylesterase
MERSTTGRLSTARVVALALIGAAVLGLAYLHFATGEDPVSVPSGAHAGQLKLHPCHYATEGGSYAADCGTLVVRENRHKASSRLIALPVKRIRARLATPGAPIFRLQGGPGISNMEFAAASRLADKHDVVLVGFRGIDGSTRLDCREVVSARAHARDLLSEKSYREVAAAFKSCAHRLQSSGIDLAGYTLPERLDDLDAARQALGYPRIDLVSESAGTRAAMVYAWRYPNRIHRSVMIGVNPPGRYLWDAKTTGEQIDRYAALCAKDAPCRSRTPDLAASLHSAYERLPGRWWFLPIKKGDVKAAGFFGLFNATGEGAGPLPAPKTIDTLLSAGRGDGSGAWFLALMAQLAFPRAQVWGDVAAIGRDDAAYARRFFARHADRGSVIGSPGTDLIWAGGRLLDSWPASPDENEYSRVRDSKVETLLVGGALDFATPPQTAKRELLPHLPNGHQVVLAGIGHSDDFWAYEPAAGKRLLNTFFETGRVDRSLYRTNRIDFTPGFSHGAIAKIILAVMLAFAALTILSLLWLPVRVHRRGGFGRKASAGLRSGYVVLLGLGGWFIGALIVLVALPTVPLDDELLAALSVGLPVGLGIYFAWMNSDWAANTKAIGLAAAIGGAIVGGWLGFHAIEGLFALVTAIVGAAVGANLILLALDIAWDRQARDRFPAPSIKEALEARPGLLPE